MSPNTDDPRTESRRETKRRDSERGAELPRDREFVHGLERGFLVIMAFEGATAPLATSQVAVRTGLTRAVARRYLLTLEELGYVASAAGGFVLTPRVLQLGFEAQSSISLAEAARPLMLKVVNELHESCSLCVLDGHDVVYVERVTANRIMTTRLAVGSRLPAHSTAMGRVLLAYLAPDKLDEYFATATLTPLTDRTVTDKGKLRRLLEETRQRGWAMNDGGAENGVSAVAAPVMDRTGKVVAALNSAAHASRVSMRQLQSQHLPVVLETAAALSRTLGAR